MKINASNATYDVLNSLVRYVLPALGTLYFGLSELWGLPEAERVVGTVVLLEAFLGVLIYLARRGWKVEEPEFDGEILVDAQEEGTDLLTVALDSPPEDVRTKDSLNLKVVRDTVKPEEYGL